MNYLLSSMNLSLSLVEEIEKFANPVQTRGKFFTRVFIHSLTHSLMPDLVGKELLVLNFLYLQYHELLYSIIVVILSIIIIICIISTDIIVTHYYYFSLWM